METTGTKKRRRRFFTDSFKKETVFKIKTNQVSIDEVKNQFHIPKLLIQRWCLRYQGVGQIPQASQGISIEQSLDRLVDSLVAKRLEQLLTQYNQTMQVGAPKTSYRNHSAGQPR